MLLYKQQVHMYLMIHIDMLETVCVCVSRNLRKTESRKNKLEDQLNSVGAKVNELKEKYVSFQLTIHSSSL